jgi:hypothetical protein
VASGHVNQFGATQFLQLFTTISMVYRFLRQAPRASRGQRGGNIVQCWRRGTRDTFLVARSRPVDPRCQAPSAFAASDIEPVWPLVEKDLFLGFSPSAPTAMWGILIDELPRGLPKPPGRSGSKGAVGRHSLTYFCLTITQLHRLARCAPRCASRRRGARATDLYVRKSMDLLVNRLTQQEGGNHEST